MAGLTNAEITRLVTRYIGVHEGHLGTQFDRFSYQSHADFYPEYCDLGIDPNHRKRRSGTILVPKLWEIELAFVGEAVGFGARDR